METLQLTEFEALLRPRLQSTLLTCTQGIQPERLRGAVQHLLGLGKLFRPLLALAVRSSFLQSAESPVVSSQDLDLLIPLEMVHTFTLVHDDLPCMDDASLRRGRPAVHMAYGEAMAVLAGDDLLTLAFDALARADADAAVRVELLRILAAATHQVVQGQVLDMAAEGADYDLTKLEELHRLKTGALLSAACLSGAVLAGAEPQVKAALGRIGSDIGLAFQIRDDLLSLESTETDMGKTLHTDTSRQKSTFPRVLGISGAREYADRLLSGITDSIQALDLADPGLLLSYARLATSRST